MYGNTDQISKTRDRMNSKLKFATVIYDLTERNALHLTYKLLKADPSENRTMVTYEEYSLRNVLSVHEVARHRGTCLRRLGSNRTSKYDPFFRLSLNWLGYRFACSMYKLI